MPGTNRQYTTEWGICVKHFYVFVLQKCGHQLRPVAGVYPIPVKLIGSIMDKGRMHYNAEHCTSFVYAFRDKKAKVYLASMAVH